MRVLLGRKRYAQKAGILIACAALLYFIISSTSDTGAVLKGRKVDNGNGDFQPKRATLTERPMDLRILDEPRQKGSKMILLWHAREWKKKVIDPENCGRCVFTSNRSEINNSDTAAVIFRSEQIDQNQMPATEARRSDQIYIWSSGEPAPSLFHLRKMWLFWEDKYKFNMTMSYRRDSSLYHPYGTVYEAYERVRERGYTKDVQFLLRQKEKLAIAVVSNCMSTPGARARLGLLQNLAFSGLKVDLFGKCFPNSTVAKRNTEELTAVLSQYKFYLAFENSYHCRDYITEKFYRNALYIGVVPVVWGTAKEDYAAVAPPGSFIHVEDYSTTNELVSYLNYLDNNDTAYLKYFSWYSTFAPKGSFGRDFSYCLLCRIVNGMGAKEESSLGVYRYFVDNATQRTIPSLRSWFYNNQRDCLRTNLRLFGNETKIY